jgi:hypothetical protein
MWEDSLYNLESEEYFHMERIIQIGGKFQQEEKLYEVGLMLAQGGDREVGKLAGGELS